jgi:anti-sigma regulatory factor (Ser/Thr protein kinase)
MVTLLIIITLSLILLLAAFWNRPYIQHSRLPARLESSREVARIALAAADRIQFSEDEVFQCRLALDEACTNIVEHAYKSDEDGEFEIFVLACDGELQLHLTDYGEPYIPADTMYPPAANSLEDIRPGGLGLYFMRRVMDKVEYTPGPDGNRLILIKRRRAIEIVH